MGQTYTDKPQKPPQDDRTPVQPAPQPSQDEPWQPSPTQRPPGREEDPDRDRDRR